MIKGNICMVILSIEQSIQLNEDIEMMLDETDKFVESTKKRLTHDEVFENIRNNLCKDCKSSFWTLLLCFLIKELKLKKC